MDNGVSGVLYIKTPSGILRIIETVFASCAFISVLVYDAKWSSDTIVFIGVVSVIALLYSLFIVIGSITNLGSANTELWRKINLLLCVVIAILSFTSAALWTSSFKIHAALASAVVFAYLMGFAYFGNVALKIFTT